MNRASTLAAMAMGLSAVGIFSVTSLAVSRRTREIGIRIAVGAQKGDIGRLVVGQLLPALALGLVAGLVAAFASAGLVRGLLHGVEPTAFRRD